MFVFTFKWSKKTAVAIVLVIALILVAIISIAAASHSKTTATSENEITNIKNEKKRIEYLKQYGWEAKSPAVSEDKVLIPKEFSAVFDKYNELQKKQGFDLSDYCGLEVETYTYEITNYNSSETVLAQLYIYKGTVIAADIHSTALDGFITGIKK